MPYEPTTGVLDIFLAIAAVATVVTLVRSWGTFAGAELTTASRRIASQVAVFLVPPVVVLFHELGHFLTAKALGVEVTDFRYGLFEGSVSLAGPVSPGESWFIALAGNLVSIGAGLAMVWVGVSARKVRRPFRYVLVFGGLLELVFSLVGYPVLSLLLTFGDWVFIYDRDSHPELFWATALVHGAALVTLWNWWRQRGKQTLFGITHGTEEEQAKLRKVVDEVPAQIEGWLELVNFYGRYGELALARTTLDEAVAACGDTPRLHLGRARVAMFLRRWNDAMLAARQGLDGKPDDEETQQRLWANLALSLTLLDRPDHALTAYGNISPPMADDPRVRYGRGLMRVASGDKDGGHDDLRAVVGSLPEDNLLRRWAEAQLEGKPLEVVPDRRPTRVHAELDTPARTAGGHLGVRRALAVALLTAAAAGVACGDGGGDEPVTAASWKAKHGSAVAEVKTGLAAARTEQRNGNPALIIGACRQLQEAVPAARASLPAPDPGLDGALRTLLDGVAKGTDDCVKAMGTDDSRLLERSIAELREAEGTVDAVDRALSDWR